MIKSRLLLQVFFTATQITAEEFIGIKLVLIYTLVYR